MAARGAKTKRKSSSSKKKSSINSAQANKLAAFGFTGFLVLMAGAMPTAYVVLAPAAVLTVRSVLIGPQLYGTVGAALICVPVQEIVRAVRPPSVTVPGVVPKFAPVTSHA